MARTVKAADPARYQRTLGSALALSDAQIGTLESKAVSLLREKVRPFLVNSSLPDVEALQTEVEQVLREIDTEISFRESIEARLQEFGTNGDSANGDGIETPPNE